METGTGRNLQGKNRGSEETLLGERLFHCILILRWLRGTEKYKMAPCSCCQYPAACKIEDGYIWKPAANFSKYSLSTFPVYSLLEWGLLCTWAGPPQLDRKQNCVSCRLWMWLCRAGRAKEGCHRSVLSSTCCFSDFPLVVLLSLGYCSTALTPKGSPSISWRAQLSALVTS